MRTLSLVMICSLAGVAPASGQTPAASTPNQAGGMQLQIGLHVYRGDREIATSTSRNVDQVSGYLWTDASLCAAGAGPSDPGRSNVIAWHVSARVQSRIGDEYLLNVEWQRTGPDGVRDGKPTVRVRVGAAATIDDVSPAVNGCGATTARVEVAMVPNEPQQFGSRATGVGGAGAGGYWGALGVPGEGSMGLARSLAALTDNRLAHGRDSNAVDNGNAIVWNSRLPAEKLQPMAAASYDAEVWLVHTPPAGSERTERLSAHIGSDGVEFQFPPLPVSTTDGVRNVDVAVLLRTFADAAGSVKLRVVIARTIVGTTHISGATIKVISLPASADVTSFELPPVSGKGEDLFTGHQLALRLKIVPGK